MARKPSQYIVVTASVDGEVKRRKLIGHDDTYANAFACCVYAVKSGNMKKAQVMRVLPHDVEVGKTVVLVSVYPKNGAVWYKPVGRESRPLEDNWDKKEYPVESGRPRDEF